MSSSKRYVESLLTRARNMQGWPATALFFSFVTWMVLKQGLALKVLGHGEWDRTILAITGSLLIITPWIRLASGRKQAILYGVVNVALTVLAYADILYYRRFAELTSVASLRFIGQLGTVSSSVTELVLAQDLMLFLDMPVFVLLALLPKSLSTCWFKPALWRRMVSTAAAGLVSLLVLGASDPVLSHPHYDHTMVGHRMGLINYHVMDAGAYVARLTSRLLPNEDALNAVEGWFGARPTPVSRPLAGVATGKNVIAVQLESFQSFVMDLKVDGQEVTPNLNRLARESIYFPNAYHQTGQGVTSDADLLVNCSLHPTRTGAVYYDFEENHFLCLPTLYRSAGYTAVAMQGMPAEFWNLESIYPQIGMEHYYSIEDFELDEIIGLGLSDHSFFRQSVEKMAELPEPYYAFVVGLTSHNPFAFPNMPKWLELGGLEGTRAGDYLHAVHYTDWALGQLLADLKSRSMLDDAVLMVYGDHNGIWNTEPGMYELLGVPASDVVGSAFIDKQIPFMIRLPHGEHAGIAPQPVGQVDFGPTVASLVGLRTDHAFLMGQDRIHQPDGPVPLNNGAVVTDQYLFIPPEGTVEQGSCYLLSAEEQVDEARCQAIFQAGMTQLSISRLMVERDLIPDLLQRRAFLNFGPRD